MLWDLVLDFFIHHIFGGVDTQGVYYYACLGFNYNEGSGEYTAIYTSNGFRYSFLTTQYGSNMYMPLGNYLSLIATIITMVALVIFSFIIIKKIISVFIRLFTFGA